MNKTTKKKLYIALFIFLGFELFFLVAVLFETLYTDLLRIDFQKYGFGLSWQGLEAVGFAGAAIFLAIGSVYGLGQGKYWWHEVYEGDGKGAFLRKRKIFFKKK
jgi:hypothetical protein